MPTLDEPAGAKRGCWLWFNLATDLDDPPLAFTNSWIRAAARQIDQIHVITMRAGRMEIPENVQVHSVGKESGYSEPRRAAEFYRHLFRILREERVTACFSHMMPTFTVLAGPILRALGIPIVTWYAHPSRTQMLKLAHRFSRRMVTSLPAAYPYRQDKLVVIGQGIDTDLFSPRETEQPQNPPLILCAGRLSPVKEHSTLIDAVHLLRQGWGRPFRLVILGRPATPQDELYVESLRVRIEERGLHGTVEIVDAVPMARLPEWYRQCAVHVNLTPAGFGDKVALEGMSCARPSLVANKDFDETLGEYADRLLFRHGSPSHLAERLQSVLTLREEERARIGAYLREQVVQHHSLERLTRRLREVLGCRMTHSEGS